MRARLKLWWATKATQTITMLAELLTVDDAIQASHCCVGSYFALHTYNYTANGRCLATRIDSRSVELFQVLPSLRFNIRMLRPRQISAYLLLSGPLKKSFSSTGFDPN